ncbi:MAG: hypothetical protein ACPG4M_01125, partial [Alphaproteobacteria bacterium]
EALGDKRGINRYGHAYVPMDEALARAVVDFSGRPHLVWDAEFEMPTLGTMETELFREFFQGVTNAAQANVHISVLYGANSHHKAEACFKAFARAVRMPVRFVWRRPLISAQQIRSHRPRARWTADL